MRSRSKASPRTRRQERISWRFRRHGEHATIAPSLHRRVVHLLGVRRRPDERARRRRARDIGRRVLSGPKDLGGIDDAIVTQLFVIERRPPPAVPAAVVPAVLIVRLALDAFPFPSAFLVNTDATLGHSRRRARHLS